MYQPFTNQEVKSQVIKFRAAMARKDADASVHGIKLGSMMRANQWNMNHVERLFAAEE